MSNLARRISTVHPTSISTASRAVVAMPSCNTSLTTTMNTRSFSNFYTPYQDNLEVISTKSNTTVKPPTPPPAEPNYVPEAGETLEIRNQQIFLLGPQQSNVEAVAYMLAQSYESPVREVNHYTIDSVMKELSTVDKGYILWSDNPDIMTNSPLATVLPTPMIITIYLDYPASSLPAMTELTATDFEHQYAVHDEGVENAIYAKNRGKPLATDPITSPSAHQHDTAHYYERHYDYRVLVSPGETSNMIYDRINSRLMQSEAYVSTRVLTSQDNMMMQMSAEEEQGMENGGVGEADLINFQQTFDQVYDSEGGCFVPDSPSPWLLTKHMMYKLDDQGDLQQVSAREALANLPEEDEEEGEQGGSAAETGMTSEMEQNAPDIQGSVIEIAFLPQTMSRMLELTYEQRLQRVLEALPLGNIPPHMLSKAITDAFFQWSTTPATIAPVTLTQSPDVYTNTFMLELFHGPNGTYTDLSHAIMAQVMSAAVQYNSYLASLNDMPQHRHRSIAYISGQGVNNTISTLTHINEDFPLVSLLPLNTARRAVPDSLAVEEQDRVPIGHLEAKVIDIALLLARLEQNPQYVAGIKSGDYYSIPTEICPQTIAKELLTWHEGRDMIQDNIQSAFTITTSDHVLPIQTSALSSTILHGYLDLLQRQVIGHLPEYNEEMTKKHVQIQLSNQMQERTAEMIDDIAQNEDIKEFEAEMKKQGVVDEHKDVEDGEDGEEGVENYGEEEYEEENDLLTKPKKYTNARALKEQAYIKELTDAYAAKQVEQQTDTSSTTSTSSSTISKGDMHDNLAASYSNIFNQGYIDFNIENIIQRAYAPGSPQAYSQWDFPLFKVKDTVHPGRITFNTIESSLEPTCIDVALNSAHFDMVLASIVSRDYGVPIRTISIGFDDTHRIAYDLFKYGVVRAPTTVASSKYVTPQVISEIERIVYILSGRNQALTKSIVAALQEHVDYTLARLDNAMYGTGQHPVEKSLERLTDSDFSVLNRHLDHQKKHILDHNKLLDVDTPVEDCTITAHLDQETLRNFTSLFHVDIIAKRTESRIIRKYLENGRILDRSSALSIAALRNLKRSISIAYPNQHIGSNKRRLKYFDLSVPVLVPALYHPERDATELLNIITKRSRHTVSRRASGEDLKTQALSEISSLYSTAKEVFSESNTSTSTQNTDGPVKVLPPRHPDIATLIEDSGLAALTSPSIPILPEHKDVIKQSVISYITNTVGGKMSNVIDQHVLDAIAAKAKEDTARQSKEVLERRYVNASTGRKKMERKN